ncbi:MAG: DUF2891 domain-containing protein [Gammaproteobacteria bacterium]
MSKRLDADMAARLATTARAAIEREYPNHLTHWLNAADDAGTPRELHPAFYGCLDWHSAVHNHWLLARLFRLFPTSDFSAQNRKLLDDRFTSASITDEQAYFAAPDREGFERPYGWAWLLALDSELAALPDLRSILSPLVELISVRIAPWLAALPYPVRSGEHANTAFALGLMLDWSRATGHTALETVIATAAERLYRVDRNASLAFEPSGHDFLSPVLAEADLMSRLLGADELAVWLAQFLSDIPETADVSWLEPAQAPDCADYKLAHLAGLNLSRAWMLNGVASALPVNDLRRPTLKAAAADHLGTGLAAALREDYGASHWLPTFAVYALTGGILKI